jgi:hypothetical protein
MPPSGKPRIAANESRNESVHAASEKGQVCRPSKVFPLQENPSTEISLVLVISSLGLERRCAMVSVQSHARTARFVSRPFRRAFHRSAGRVKRSLLSRHGLDDLGGHQTAVGCNDIRRLWLLVVGGLAYSAGVGFFLAKRLPHISPFRRLVWLHVRSSFYGMYRPDGDGSWLDFASL